MARDRTGSTGPDGGDSGGRGKGKGGGNNREIDLSADPSYLWRFIRTNIGAAANDFGRAGYDIGAVKAALDAAEALLGPRLTGTAINAVAAAVQEPQIVKDFVHRMGWPEQINALADDFIDDLFEGLRMGLRDGHKKLHEDTVNKAEQRARDSLREKLGGLQVMSPDDALGHLSVAQQQIWTAAVSRLNAEQRKIFHATYIRRIAAGGIGGMRAFVLAANGKTADEIMEYLSVMYGAPQAAGSTIIDKVVGGIKAIDTAAQRHLGVADPNNDPVNDKLRGLAAKLKRRRGVW